MGLTVVGWNLELRCRTDEAITLVDGAVAAHCIHERASVGLALRLVGHPMNFAMQRQELLEIKRRAERARTSRP